jgi:hypothetical protein
MSQNIQTTKARTRSSRPAAPSALRAEVAAQNIDPDSESGKWLVRLLHAGERGEKKTKV